MTTPVAGLGTVRACSPARQAMLATILNARLTDYYSLRSYAVTAPPTALAETDLVAYQLKSVEQSLTVANACPERTARMTVEEIGTPVARGW